MFNSTPIEKKNAIQLTDEQRGALEYLVQSRINPTIRWQTCKLQIEGEILDFFRKEGFLDQEDNLTPKAFEVTGNANSTAQIITRLIAKLFKWLKKTFTRNHN